MIKVVKKNESGYYEALIGIGLNKKQGKDMRGVAEKLAPMDGGHNKFLESIQVWLEVTAPRFWWQEADTYRLSTKQSESTMHTLLKEAKQGIDKNVFDERTNMCVINMFNDLVVNTLTNEFISDSEQLTIIKANLPEGFLQKRMWCLSYKTLKNIVEKRANHRLPHWREFVKQVLEQVEHPELLPNEGRD